MTKAFQWGMSGIMLSDRALVGACQALCCLIELLLGHVLYDAAIGTYQ